MPTERKKCGMPVENWTRVCGYFRPYKTQSGGSTFNKGKQQEVKERVMYKVPSLESLSKPSNSKMIYVPRTPEQLRAVDYELSKQEGQPVEVSKVA